MLRIVEHFDSSLVKFPQGRSQLIESGVPTLIQVWEEFPKGDPKLLTTPITVSACNPASREPKAS